MLVLLFSHPIALLVNPSIAIQCLHIPLPLLAGLNMAPVYTKPSIETGDFSESIWEGQIAVKQTHLRNCISALSDQAAVLATCVSVQVRGELGIGTNGRLDGDNNIAGEVGNSSHWE
jgi:hypothetical protein